MGAFLLRYLETVLVATTTIIIAKVIDNYFEEKRRTA
jgi:hypothetical protein